MDLSKLEHLIGGLDRDRQLRDNPSLKRKIKRLLEAQLKTRDRGQNHIPKCTFAPNAPVAHHPKPEPVTTETPIEQIRRKNRYIK